MKFAVPCRPTLCTQLLHKIKVGNSKSHQCHYIALMLLKVSLISADMILVTNDHIFLVRNSVCFSVGLGILFFIIM